MNENKDNNKNMMNENRVYRPSWNVLRLCAGGAGRRVKANWERPKWMMKGGELQGHGDIIGGV
jgi:hypothetical protein